VDKESEHYYTAQPSTEHDESAFTATMRGQTFTFTTDTSVFSRNRVDFGTALLIEALEIQPNDIVLDLGCGYGPIGIAAARLATEGKVYMVDVNERAAGLARRNLIANEITNAEVEVGDALDPVRGLIFDHVVTNPPIRTGKANVYRMIDEAQKALKSGGSLWVVIQTKQGAPSMKKKLGELFPQVDDVDRQAGFHIFRAVKA
jgi:16S rRNA (guanine1207-N2)-methyltransferase